MTTLKRSMVAGAALLWLAAVPAPALAQMQTEQAPVTDGSIDPKVMREQALAEYEIERDAKTPGQDNARIALAAFTGCVAREDAGTARQLLTMDFRDPAYRRGLAGLARESSPRCLTGDLRSAQLRAPGLLFAGGLAEGLMMQGDGSIGPRLALAAGKPATTAFSFTDKVAICVVRSVPDQLAALFALPVASAAEEKALSAIAVPMALCAKAFDAKKQLEINPAGLRAMLATAAFRTLASTEVAS